MKFTEFANIPTMDSKKIIADLKDTKAGAIGAPLRDLEEWMLVIAENYDEALKDKIHSPLVGWLKQPDRSYALSFKNGKWNLTEFKKDFSSKVIGESEELVDIELRAKKTLKNFPSIPLQLEDALKKANVFESVRRSRGQLIKESDESTSFNHRSLRLIAKEIRADWKNITSSYAYPYYQAIADSNKITDTYGADDVYGIVLYFLSNASGWKGEKAREIKAELKKMCKDYEKYRGFKESLVNESVDETLYTLDDFTFTELLPSVIKVKLPKASGTAKMIMHYFFEHIKKDSRVEGVYDLRAYYTPWEHINGKAIKKEPIFEPRKSLRISSTLKMKTGYLIYAPESDIATVKKMFSFAVAKAEKRIEDDIEYREGSKERAKERNAFSYEKRKNDQKELEAKYGKDVISRVKIRKYMGDDLYSWAVFVDGRPIITGLNQRSANFEKIQAYKRLSKNTPARVTEEKTKDIKIADISKVYPLKRDGFIYGLDDEKFILYTHSTPRGKPIFRIFKEYTKYVVRVLDRKEVRLDTLSEVLSYLNKQKIDKIVDKVPTDETILKFLNKWVGLPKKFKLTSENVKELSFKLLSNNTLLDIVHPEYDYDDDEEFFVFGEGEEEPTNRGRYGVIGISEVGLTVDDLTKWLIKNKAKAIKK